MSSSSKSIARSLGEFFGHIIKGVRANPSKRVLKHSVEEENVGSSMILRRTTIEEIELTSKSPQVANKAS